MAMEQKKLIAIVCVVVVIIAAAAAAVLLMGGDKGGDSNGLVIDGSSISQSQLDDAKKEAEKDSSYTLTFNESGYTVVFDSKAISSISAPGELAINDVATSSLEVKDILTEGASAISISFGDNKSFGDGTVKVTIDKKISEEKTGSVVALFVDGNNMTVVPHTVVDGKVTLILNHFSTYVVAYASTVYDAGLKVFGNVNGDTVIDQSDVDMLNKLVEGNVPYELYPIADANQDKKIDADDVAVIQDVINGSTTTIWHVNYHDFDNNGTMDMEIVSTKVPVTSAIATGSANTLIMLYMNGIIDEIKGASYSSTSVDTYLYKDAYLDTKKVEKLGSSSTTITFEDGKAGSSDIIARENVTLLLTDWNRTYITNEKNFRDAGIDVLRIAAASTDKEIYTHSIMLLGLVFNKVETSSAVLKAYDDTFDNIDKAVSTIPQDKVVKAVASSNNGDLSGPDSDYTAFVKRAGAQYGLTGFDFGGSSAIKVADNLDVFNTNKYQYDYIVHIRTALTYANKQADIGEKWSQYANAMDRWEHAYDGQVLVSGSVPVPVRVAYIAYSMYGETVDALNLSWADNVRQVFEGFYGKDVSDAPNKQLCITSFEYSIDYGSDVVVKDEKGNVVEPGTKFSYGTKLFVSATSVKDNFVFRGYGDMYNPTIQDDGSFYVVDNISLKYISQDVVNLLNGYSADFVDAYGKSQVYGTASVGSKDGSFKISNTSYTGTDQTKEYSYSYYDSVEDATQKFTELQALWEKKSSKNIYDASDSPFDNISVRFSSSASAGKYAYSTIYLCAQKGNIVIDMVNSYLSNYYLAGTAKGDELLAMSSDDLFNFFNDGVKTFVDALGKTFEGDAPEKSTGTITDEIAQKFKQDKQVFDVDDRVSLSEFYQNSKTTKTLNSVISIGKYEDAADYYGLLANELEANGGSHIAYMSKTLEKFDGAVIDGVQYVALAKATSTSIYLELVMVCGDYVLHVSTGSGGVVLNGYGADDTQDVIDFFASVLKA